MYLVWSLVASTGAASPYEELYSDDEDDDGAESPKKAGYVIIHGAEDVVAVIVTECAEFSPLTGVSVE
ncbi:hypothetical protein TRIUR3_26892 [Triticum urartu]|uniref:Uncharacterized protein n=1 Tax=Triticum urartu TaxID=4572 RepID=M7ZLP7_TRIUA|nr:hypothetical protein TRIUR3_26892 [Triticum urartu]